MAGRRYLLAVVLLASLLHAISIAPVAPARPGRPEVHPGRPPVPAGSLAGRRPRDGPAPALPGPDRGRRADRSRVRGLRARTPGGSPPRSSRPLASLAILFPLFGLTRSLFDERIAVLAVGDLRPAAGPRGGRPRHAERQPGPLAIAALLAVAARSRCGREAGGSALAAGLAGGVGYLARPEVVLAPAALGAGLVVILVAALRVPAGAAPLPHCRPWACRVLVLGRRPMPW